ncbi:MAG: methyltransferase domain-containing protein [Peptostreptococcaceae bacterium]|nr:methyltransferase domain-containing protein [Peptostreptococcaceae bacterium]
METKLEKGERIDCIRFGDLRLIQKPEDFCYGVDAVLLAHFAATDGEQKNIKRVKSKRAMDLGTGTGIVPLILSHKTDITEIFGLEIQKESFQRALRNMELNGLEKRIEILYGDVSDIENVINKDFVGTFDMVTANPPYILKNGAVKNEKTAKMIARHETSGLIDDFIKTAALLLKPKCDFYMVHRPSRLIDICVSCRVNKLEPKGIRLVSPREGEIPNIMLIHCVKYGNPELKFMKNLNIYEGTSYSKEIKEIYER